MLGRGFEPECLWNVCWCVDQKASARTRYYPFHRVLVFFTQQKSEQITSQAVSKYFNKVFLSNVERRRRSQVRMRLVTASGSSTSIDR